MAVPLPEVDPDVLKPYASFAVLRYTGPDPEVSATQAVVAVRRAAERLRGRRRVQMMRAGIAPGWIQQQTRAEDDDQSGEIDAFSFRVEKDPSWAQPGSGFDRISDELCVIFRQRDLVAIHCPRFLIGPVQKWLNSDPRPPFVRAEAESLQQAFLRGAAKGLWLRGTHRRTRSKADTKTMSGQALEDALHPHEDGSFVLASGRSAVVHGGRLGDEGTVGVTPDKAWVWLKQTGSLAEFVHLARAVLTMVEEVDRTPHAERLFPQLAEKVRNLDAVRSAYEVYVTSSDFVASQPDTDDEDVDRAELLQDAILDVEGSDRSPGFVLSVGSGGAEVGRLRYRPQLSGDEQVTLEVSIAGTPSDPVACVEIRDLIASGDLLNVHYASGHRILANSIARPNEEHQPFTRWRFKDFSGSTITAEKPIAAGAQSIHDAIDVAGDQSLFAWVVGQFPSGHLTCDDGANEVADFVHLDAGGLLTLVHVKAGRSGDRRQVSTGAYELVVSQATKNLTYLRPELLVAALETSPVARPATWCNGARVADRTAMLDALRSRRADAEVRVVVVQPHVAEARHKALRDLESAGGHSLELSRLHLVENMLQSARRTFVDLNADLEVWARA